MHNGTTSGSPVSFLFGRVFLFFYKEKKKPQSQHIADYVRCATLRTQPGQEVTTVTALQNLTPG
ncbi:MAG: hypothetical protein DRP85_08170 [Candidatus Makaraimicrobium thalassicum]|nr:MAG: hypothetical protein DRP85_08170 [Candidatus Omnitrophota bacterium]